MSSPLTLPISLVVIAYNEAANIARCLDSVPFATEKIVLDCGSDDDTRAIAAAHGARVIEQPWLGFGAQRNFAAGLASHEWILSLDADEALTPQLVGALELGLLCSNDPVCAQHDPENRQEHRHLHGAACHGCVLTAETSCEQQNDFLDRALVVKTVEELGAELFSDAGW